MDQRTHSWIAIRAIALLKDDGKEENLVKLLEPHAKEATVGAWIPDQIDAKKAGGSITDNHVLKIRILDEEKDNKKGQKKRFTTSKNEMLEQIGGHRKIKEFLARRDNLGKEWWGKPYYAEIPKRGQHLPNRAMALSTMIEDLLLMGNQKIDDLIPGGVSYIESLTPDMRTSEDAAAMYFFMLSHFLADSGVPCHCDGRPLAKYSAGLHNKLEKHWSKKVGTDFEKGKILKPTVRAKDVLKMARDVDSKFVGLDFSKTTVPSLMKGNDVWLEMMKVCRASFAAANIIAPPGKYQKKAKFEDVFGNGGEELLKDVDRTTMYDAVLNTAIVWKHIWNKVKS
jgi:hypothetical protein